MCLVYNPRLAEKTSPQFIEWFKLMFKKGLNILGTNVNEQKPAHITFTLNINFTFNAKPISKVKDCKYIGIHPNRRLT